MALTQQQAAILCQLIEQCADANWPANANPVKPKVKERMKTQGLSGTVICDAWLELERIAGRIGGVPDPSEFDDEDPQ